MLTTILTILVAVFTAGALRENHKILGGLWSLPARTPEQQELREMSVLYRILHSGTFTIGVFLPFFFDDIRTLVVFFVAMFLSQKWVLKSSEIEELLRHDIEISPSPRLRLTPTE